MDISVIGAGVVGQATGKGFARLGHNVDFFDVDREVAEKLGKEGFNANLSNPWLNEVNFICTPEKTIPDVLNNLQLQTSTDPERARPVIAIRSTVPIGTCASYHHVCHNPEFLREAVAEYEFMNPKRVVIGECCKEHGDILEKLYKPFNVPIIRVNPTTSEFIKLATNAYLATIISFWNQVHLIMNEYNVNSHVVGKACSLDPRISEYGASMHGKSYGGICLPKDLEHLRNADIKVDACPLDLLDAVKKINEVMKG